MRVRLTHAEFECLRKGGFLGEAARSALKRFAEVEGLLQSILAGENTWSNGKPLIPRCEDPV